MPKCVQSSELLLRAAAARRRTARDGGRAAARTARGPRPSATSRSRRAAAGCGRRRSPRTAGTRSWRQSHPSGGPTEPASWSPGRGTGQRQERHATEQDQTRGIAVGQQMGDAPQRDAPHHRMAGHPENAHRLPVQHLRRVAAERRRIGRAHAGDDEETGERHDGQRQVHQPDRRQPDILDRRVPVGHRHPDDQRDGYQRIDGAEAPLAQPADQGLSQLGHRQTRWLAMNSTTAAANADRLPVMVKLPSDSSGCAARQSPPARARGV